MAATPSVNIVIAQGTDFSEVFKSTESDGTASNLAGYMGASKIKKYSGSPKSQSFSVSITGATGEVSIAMTAGTTLKLAPGRYNYDVVLTSPSGAISRMVEGQAMVTAGITT
jgi:hypothetical protein